MKNINFNQLNILFQTLEYDEVYFEKIDNDLTSIIINFIFNTKGNESLLSFKYMEELD